MLPIAITTGEPAGIGPEIALRAVLASVHPCVLLGDQDLLAATARATGIAWPLPDRCRVEHEPLAYPAVAGCLDVRNARYVLRLLDRAVDAWRRGRIGAIVTAPLHKAVINEAGIPFQGHTEYLSAATGGALPVMLLVGGGMKVALATTHLALSRVPAAITRPLLGSVIEVLDRDLRTRFGIAHPRIAVAGLNPHAGESGYLGREEIDVIAPAIEQARRDGIDASGPWPADTLFVPSTARGQDAILAMYHDQGLAPLKFASFGQGVNVTLGLPLIRTSVDHGTALDLAGSGKADPRSLLAAVDLAQQLLAVAAAAGTAPLDGASTARSSPV